MMFNKFLSFTQAKLNFLYENSLFLQNIDKLIFVSILAVFIASTFLTSDTIGFLALITIFLTVIRLITTPQDKLAPKTFELWLLAYFMIVTVSLAGSSMFMLSLKGFLKTVTYLGFYLSTAHFLKNNCSKIPYIIGVIALCITFEGIAGFSQNFMFLEEISTWQDTANLNPEEVMSRIYGTLKPYNPNLLGGYFAAGLPCLLGSGAYFLYEKKWKCAIISAVFAIITVISLFSTGCRGSYLALIIIFAGVFFVSAKFFWKDYKKIYMSAAGACITAVTFAVLCISSLRARFFSIFAMRSDSSNSFRFNVYQSSFEMFKDNWLLGIGVGNQNFREIYGLYMKTGYDALSAYNIFLETAVESGIFALIAFLGFIIAAMNTAITYILKSNDMKNVIFVSTAVISVAALMVHGLVDTVFFRPQIQFIFWTMIAIISALSAKSNINNI